MPVKVFIKNPLKLFTATSTLAIIVLLCLYLHWNHMAMERARDEGLTHTGQLFSQMSEEMFRSIGMTFELINARLIDNGILENPTAAENAFFDSATMLSAMSHYNILDLEGNILLSAFGNQYDNNLQVSTIRDLAQKATVSFGLVAGPAVKTVNSQAWVLPLALAHHSDDGGHGIVLVAALKIQEPESWRSVNIPNDISVLVVSGAGVVSYAVDSRGVKTYLVGKKLPYEIMDKLKEATSSHVEVILDEEDEDGRVAAIATPIKGTDLQVVAVVSDVILEDILTQQSVFAVTVAMLMMFGLGVFYYRSLQSERILYHKGHYDALTGLPNRQTALDLLTALTRDEDTPFALLFIDIDNFKQVNDVFGHASGDVLLMEYARRLQGLLRQTDTVARLGGDEFLVILPGVGQSEKASVVASKILEEFSFPIGIGEGASGSVEIVASPSIGISLFPDNGGNATTLMKSADMAMYSSKKAGKNHYSFYDHSHDDIGARRYAVETALRRALDNNELTVFYQTQIEAASGRVVGAEALLRWNCPSLGGSVSPAEFIPIAEETGLIVPVGKFVMQQACYDLPLLQQQFGQDIRVAINVSAKQFRRNDIAASLQELVGSMEVDPRNLEIEITESMLIDPSSGAAEALKTLKDWGISIAVDDFGTGFSSLNYLRKYPVSTLKIDRSFVSEMETSRDSATLVRSIIAMGHALGLTVVAEGVENKAQLDLLRELQCDIVQGYYFSKPQPIGQLCTNLVVNE